MGDEGRDGQTVLLEAIARARARVIDATTELEDRKDRLKASPEYEAVEDAKEEKKDAERELDKLLARVQHAYQPSLFEKAAGAVDMVLREAADAINAGALDGDGVTCTAEVRNARIVSVQG